MRLLKIPAFFCLAVAWSLTVSAQQDGANFGAVDEAGYPPLLVQTCFSCHGPGGQSQSPAIPSIAGLPRDYLLNVLAAYRYGGRFGTIMDRIMGAYDKPQVEIMADYFSRQPYRVNKQDAKWQLVDRGRQLHRRYCRECHGDGLQPSGKGAPLLIGAWMDYLRWTIRDYLIGINQGDEEMSRQLARLLRNHGEPGLEALIHYYGKGRP
ncbi:MAG: c-type cytochrome [Candidatus Thiodiazotropha taylori]|uniref:C-type cytochrome n=1 Tax=Candidatus Thiodiazotropha taylori TaxID=2792791 RepID=A0A9E4KAT9_9GAMM|nr:c-type cytochrome [Candidatus Thiodiazotropha taylori]MCW4255351.1 c-type cytochrome [Candidatus Thiodiazotropha taylori]